MLLDSVSTQFADGVPVIDGGRSIMATHSIHLKSVSSSQSTGSRPEFNLNSGNELSEEENSRSPCLTDASRLARIKSRPLLSPDASPRIISTITESRDPVVHTGKSIRSSWLGKLKRLFLPEDEKRYLGKQAKRAVRQHYDMMQRGKRIFEDIGAEKIESLQAAITLASNGQAVIAGTASYLSESGLDLGISVEQQNILRYNTAIAILDLQAPSIAIYETELCQHKKILIRADCHEKVGEIDNIFKAMRKAKLWLIDHPEDKDANQRLPGVRFKDVTRIAKEIMEYSAKIDEIRFALYSFEKTGLVVEG